MAWIDVYQTKKKFSKRELFLTFHKMSSSMIKYLLPLAFFIQKFGIYSFYSLNFASCILF
jgi:hypothetical protein